MEDLRGGGTNSSGASGHYHHHHHKRRREGRSKSEQQKERAGKGVLPGYDISGVVLVSWSNGDAVLNLGTCQRGSLCVCLYEERSG